MPPTFRLSAFAMPIVSPWLAQNAVRELASQKVPLVKLWVEDRWGFSLHFEREIVCIEARRKFGVVRVHLRLVQITDESEGFETTLRRGIGR